MRKKRKKISVKGRLRALYRVCALVCAMTVALAVPVEAEASATDEVVYSNGGFYSWEYKQGIKSFYSESIAGYPAYRLPEVDLEGATWNLSFKFQFGQDLTELDKSYITSADSVDLNFVFGNVQGTGWEGLLGVAYIGTNYCNSQNGSASINVCYTNNNRQFFADSTWGLPTITGTDMYYSAPNVTYEPLYGLGFDYFTYNASFKCFPIDRVVEPVLMAFNISCKITCHYLDSADKVFIINQQILGQLDQMNGKLDDVNDSINQGFDQIGDQIGGVQEDINSGFDEVGGKLDNIQSDINTGLDNVTGAINGEGADSSGMDNGMAQLGGQLGDLGDVEEQLGGLIMDKVEVPDLILTNDQGSALALLVSCLNLAYVDLKDYQVMFASVMFFGIVGVLLFGRRNL